jgi:hypothetical protein
MVEPKRAACDGWRARAHPRRKEARGCENSFRSARFTRFAGKTEFLHPTGGGATPVSHTPAASGVRRQDLLGGLIHEYQRAA